MIDHKLNTDGDDVTIDITVDAILIKRSLLEDIRHELVSINNLKAFDKTGHTGIGYVEVYDDDIIDLDYTELLERIDEVLK